MSTLVSSDPLVQGQYDAQVAITAALTASLRGLWAATEPLSGVTALRRYRQGIALLTEQFGTLSASTAIDFYKAARRDANVPGIPNVRPVAMPAPSLVTADVDWAFRAEQQMADDVARIQDRIEAAFQKAVTDVGRDQTGLAVEGDDKALGFARVARPGACYFCLSQAIRRSSKDGQNGRPSVYKTRDTAGGNANDFFSGSGVAKFHNNCHCVIVPVFSTDYELEPHLLAAEALYKEATSESEPGESLNDFRRALGERRGHREPKTPMVRPTVAPIDDARAMRDLLDRLAAA